MRLFTHLLTEPPSGTCLIWVSVQGPSLRESRPNTDTCHRGTYGSTGSRPTQRDVLRAGGPQEFGRQQEMLPEEGPSVCKVAPSLPHPRTHHDESQQEWEHCGTHLRPHPPVPISSWH